MRALALLLLAACKGGTDTDTDIDTNPDTPLGTDDITITLDGEPGPWTREVGSTVTFEATFTWWNSGRCAECGAMALMVVDALGFCADLDPAGTFPGVTGQLSVEHQLTGRFLDDSVLLYLQEGLDCATFNADQTTLTGTPIYSQALTQQRPGLVIEASSPSDEDAGVDVDATVSLSLSEAADIEAFPPTVTFTDADGNDVAFTTRAEDRFFRIDPDEVLTEYRTRYTVTVTGLVGVDGAEQVGTYEIDFTTEFFDPEATYELYSVAHGSDRVLHAGPGTSVVVDDNFVGQADELWTLAPVTGGYTIENVQTQRFMTAPASNPVGNPPSLELESATNNAQVWRITAATDGWRLSTVAHGDAVSLDIGNDSTTTLAFRDIASTDQQWWRIRNVIPTQ